MKTVALREVVDFYSGATPSKANAELWKGDVAWFSAKDMKRPRLSDSADHISSVVFRNSPLRRLPAGTVVLVVRGMILAHTVPISVLGVDAAINQDLKALLPRRELDSTFLAAMLRAQQSAILAQVSTAAHGTKKLDSRVLEAIRIPLLPLDEQRRIALILDHADALRAKRRQVLAHLDALTESIFHAMFDTGMGRVIALGEVADVKGGKRLPKHAAYAEAATEHPYIRVTDLREGGIRAKDLRYLTPDVQRQIARYTVDEDDVVISIAGSIGLTAVVPRDLAGANLTENAAKVVAKVSGVYSGAWLARALQTRGLKAQIAGKVGRVTIGKLALFRIEQLKLVLPPLRLQHEFLSQVQRVNAHRMAVHQALEADNALFASLQSRAFLNEL